MQRITTCSNVVLRYSISCGMVLFCFVGLSSTLLGDWRDDVGYTKLITVLGASAPNGSGVPISLVEALVTITDDKGTPDMGDDVVTSRNYKPDTNIDQFASGLDPLGQSVAFIDGSNNSCNGSCIGFSGHASGQAQNFFGNTTSLAPAANTVTLYEADDYLNRILNLNGSNNALPRTQNFRVQNFSWIGTLGSDNDDREALRRFDYAIDNNNITALVGLNNNANPLPHLLGHGYNSLAIGRSDGIHSGGLTVLGNYGQGRSKPDLVAPAGSTSSATSRASSVATFLHSAGSVLGTDASKSETMRAILMAGASKENLPSWSRSTNLAGQLQPLDDTFGAGEVNLYNSYLITLGGMTNGSRNTGTPAGSHGWDYGTIQPGGSNKLLYDFVIPTGSVAEELSIVLAWNAKIDAPFNTGDPTVANLDLELVDSNGLTVDLNFSDSLLDGLSNSVVDNVEHLYLTDLSAGAYTLKVSSNDLASDFGLAWRTSMLFESPSADFDIDGDIDGNDFLAWQRGYGTIFGGSVALGDADGDGDIDSDDLVLFSAGFGAAAAAASLSVSLGVPEPSVMALAGTGVLFYMLKRRKKLSLWQ